jgi:hypothetical protein
MKSDLGGGCLSVKARGDEFDRFLIDWADEGIQDLVASFSARRPTPALRLVVIGCYLFGLLHLLFVALLPFDRDVIARILGRGAFASEGQVTALATGIVVGAISFHLLMTTAFVALAFLVRAAKPWTRALGTAVLAVNCAMAFNSLRGLRAVQVFSVLNAAFVLLAPVIIGLLWYAAPGSRTSHLQAPRRPGSPGSKPSSPLARAPQFDERRRAEDRRG